MFPHKITLKLITVFGTSLQIHYDDIKVEDFNLKAGDLDTILIIEQILNKLGYTSDLYNTYIDDALTVLDLYRTDRTQQVKIKTKLGGIFTLLYGPEHKLKNIEEVNTYINNTPGTTLTTK